MEIQPSRQDPVRVDCGALIIPLPRGGKRTGSIQKLDRALGSRIAGFFETLNFQGKEGEVAAFPADGIAARNIVLAGLGEEKKISSDHLRQALGAGIRAAAQRQADRVAVLLPAIRGISPADQAQTIAEGALLGAYRFDAYRNVEDPPGQVEQLLVLSSDTRHAAVMRRALKTGAIIAECTNHARDLSNQPGSVHTPAWLAQRARDLGREVGLRVRVLAEKELEREKMEGILSVGRGSANPPRLIVMEHTRPKGRARAKLVLVGKGITFDSGGISIKPSAKMHEMKHDMSGAAAVFGAMRGVALLGLPLDVIGIIPAAENKPDGNAYLPGDIIRSASGKTIEVLNTDAEGRIVLADALHHATRFEPDAIIDLATLTGACVVALGSACCALMGNNERLLKVVQKAGERSHERTWPLPVWEEHKKQIRGDVGDIKNTGGREAGASTAGAFLSHFVGEIPWAHLDIAGTAWLNRATETCVQGATGFGVRLLLEMLRSWK